MWQLCLINSVSCSDSRYPSGSSNVVVLVLYDLQSYSFMETFIIINQFYSMLHTKSLPSSRDPNN